MTNERKSLSLAEFAQTRGFTAEELEEYGIEITEAGEIRIPILGRKGIEHPWKYKLHRPGGVPKYRDEVEGMGHHLYNPLGLGPGCEEVWLAEGEWDTLSLITVGAPAVGVLGASGFKRVWGHLFRHALVVVAFDPDSESEEQAKRVRDLMAWLPQTATIERFDPLKVGGYSDINDWFKADRNDLVRTVRQWQ